MHVLFQQEAQESSGMVNNVPRVTAMTSKAADRILNLRRAQVGGRTGK